MNLDLPAIDYVVIGIYLIIMIIIGFFFTRLMKGGKDFFVGGNLIPWWVAGISLYMTLFSAWTFTGAASFTYNTGWFGILFFLTWPISFFIGFQLTAKRWRRTRVTSPVEYIQKRFNRTTHLFLSIVLIFSTAYWPAHHLASLAKITAPTLFPNSMTAIDIMIVVVGLIILVYTFSGGLWAVVVTDAVQFLIFISICVVLIPTVFLSGDVGSVSDFLHAVPPLKFDHIIRGDVHYDFWYLLGIPAAYVFSYAVGGNAQRYYSVKDEKSAKKLGWVAFGLFLLSPLLFGLPPLIGKVLWPDVSMLAYFSNISKPDENIFIAVVMRYMPAGMVGIFLAAMMSASMSAMDSAWNAASAIVSVDIYKSIFKPDATDKEVLRVGRYTVIGLAILAIVMALIITHSRYGVFTFTNIFFGLTGIPIAIPLFLGIINRKISRWSAISCILAGTATASVARFGLKYDIGPQYLLTVAMTLLFIYLSYPLGRLYLKSRVRAIAASTILGLFWWLYFMLFNHNDQLSFAQIPGGVAFFGSAFFWVTLAAIGLTLLSWQFSRLYARDLQSDQSDVKAFFRQMDTPIDVEKEVMSRGVKEVNIFPLVGGISVGLSLLTLLLLLVPGSGGQLFVNLSVSGILFLIGAAMLLTGRFHRVAEPVEKI